MEHPLRATFEALYDERANEVLRFVLCKVNDEELASDILAETFLRYWKHLSAGESIAKPRAFLYRIAHGLIIDEYRKRNFRKVVPLDEENDALLGTDDTLAEQASMRESHQAALKHMALLRAEYRSVLLLYYVQELSIPEIAHALKSNENAVRVLVHRAVAALRKQMNHE